MQPDEVVVALDALNRVRGFAADRPARPVRYVLQYPRCRDARAVEASGDDAKSDHRAPDRLRREPTDGLGFSANLTMKTRKSPAGPALQMGADWVQVGEVVTAPEVFNVARQGTAFWPAVMRADGSGVTFQRTPAKRYLLVSNFGSGCRRDAVDMAPASRDANPTRNALSWAASTVTSSVSPRLDFEVLTSEATRTPTLHTSSLADLAGDDYAFQRWAPPVFRASPDREVQARPQRVERQTRGGLDVVGVRNLITLPGGELEVVFGLALEVDKRSPTATRTG
ncbi:hypothetical protein [Micromonospora sp. NPDC005299]|uniref:hypothetical protein n=1 Tax=Micromonospora sp. NPDC005299 TaxID=3364231 RepID=UPI0036BAD055